MTAGISSNMRATSAVASASRLAPVTPSDTADLAGGVSRGLHVGVAGDVAVQDATGGVAVLVSGAGQYHPVCVARVLATGTTAGGIVALY